MLRTENSASLFMSNIGVFLAEWRVGGLFDITEELRDIHTTEQEYRSERKCVA